MSGLFITFEGGEGSGKTTQIHLLHHHLLSADRKLIVTREPGGTPAGESVRELLLKGDIGKWKPLAEILLFQAARIEHVERVIRPALARDEIVLCDRFLDSTLVYQGIAKKLGVDYVRELHRLTLGGFAPDLTLILDIDPAIGLERAGKRAGEETRFESMDISFHQNVRKGFLALAAYEPARYAVINASESETEVHKAITQAVSERFAL